MAEYYGFFFEGGNITQKRRHETCACRTNISSKIISIHDDNDNKYEGAGHVKSVRPCVSRRDARAQSSRVKRKREKNVRYIPGRKCMTRSGFRMCGGVLFFISYYFRITITVISNVTARAPTRGRHRAGRKRGTVFYNTYGRKWGAASTGCSV